MNCAFYNMSLSRSCKSEQQVMAEAATQLAKNQPPTRKSTKTKAKACNNKKIPLKNDVIKKSKHKSKKNRAYKRLSKVMRPKSAREVLKELKDVTINNLTSVGSPDNGYTVSIEVNCKEYQANERSKQQAENLACELALRDCVKAKLTGPAEEDEDKDEARLNLVSFALHKLYASWEREGCVLPEMDAQEPTESNYSSQDSMRTELPANWRTLHPVHLLSMMRSNAKYVWNACTGPPGITYHRMTIIVDHQEFTVCETTKKLARRNGAALVCNSLFQTNFDMDGSPERKILRKIHPSPIAFAELSKRKLPPVGPPAKRRLPINWEAMCNMRGLHPSTTSTPVPRPSMPSEWFANQKPAGFIKPELYQATSPAPVAQLSKATQDTRPEMSPTSVAGPFIHQELSTNKKNEGFITPLAQLSQPTKGIYLAKSSTPVARPSIPTELFANKDPEVFITPELHPASSPTLVAQLSKPTEETHPATSSPIASLAKRGLPTNWESLCNIRAIHSATSSSSVAQPSKLTIPTEGIDSAMSPTSVNHQSMSTELCTNKEPEGYVMLQIHPAISFKSLAQPSKITELPTERAHPATAPTSLAQPSKSTELSKKKEPEGNTMLEIHPYKRTDLPTDWRKMSPANLLSIMRPDAKLMHHVFEQKLGIHHISISVDNQKYIASARCKKIADRNVAAIVCNKLFKTDFAIHVPPQSNIMSKTQPSKSTKLPSNKGQQSKTMPNIHPTTFPVVPPPKRMVLPANWHKMTAVVLLRFMRPDSMFMHHNSVDEQGHMVHHISIFVDGQNYIACGRSKKLATNMASAIVCNTIFHTNYVSA